MLTFTRASVSELIIPLRKCNEIHHAPKNECDHPQTAPKRNLPCKSLVFNLAVQPRTA